MLEQAASLWSTTEEEVVVPEETVPVELGNAPAAPPPPAEPPKPKPKPIDPARNRPSARLEQVIGLSLDQAQRLLGPPYMRTEMPPAKILAYDGGSCTLKVFFYLDLDSDQYRALAYEIKGGEDSDSARQRCLSEIFAGGSV